MDVQVGSVWREVDKRFTRYVKVLSISGDKAEIENCDARGEPLRMECRTTKAKLTRFGKAYKPHPPLTPA